VTFDSPGVWAGSLEHVREAFPPDSLVTRDGVARVIETMRAFDAVPANLKMDPRARATQEIVRGWSVPSRGR
jgi:hypothetical protein